jgi:hypothetical protein
MLDRLSGSTIGELFSELAQVERKIRDCDPLFVSVSSHVALSPRLIELAAMEQQICDELARRRADLRVEMEARLLAMQVPIAPMVPAALIAGQE